jgi:hypothetical protein
LNLGGAGERTTNDERGRSVVRGISAFSLPAATAEAVVVGRRFDGVGVGGRAAALAGRAG